VSQKGPTPFIEANAILAAQEGEIQVVEEIIEQLNNAELAILKTGAGNLVGACGDEITKRIKERRV
jgi:hypothetical protein